MKKIIRLTERDLARIVKRVIIENEMNNDDSNTKYSDITFENPKKNKFCKLKVGKYKHSSEDNPFKYSPILICYDEHIDEEKVEYEFGEFRGRSFDMVNKNVCKYLPELSKKIEKILNREEYDFDNINENIISDRWEILDRNINCDTNLF